MSKEPSKFELGDSVEFKFVDEEHRHEGIYTIQGKSYQSYTPTWIYSLRRKDGERIFSVHEEAIKHPGYCAECAKATINDYLCKDCRDN